MYRKPKHRVIRKEKCHLNHLVRASPSHHLSRRYTRLLNNVPSICNSLGRERILNAAAHLSPWYVNTCTQRCFFLFVYVHVLDYISLRTPLNVVLECLLKCHEKFLLSRPEASPQSFGSGRPGESGEFSPGRNGVILAWRTSKPSVPPCQ